MVGTLLVLFLVGEAFMRVYYHVKQRNIPGFVRAIELDDRLGWRSIPNLDVTKETTDALGNPYPLRVCTNALGFRRFGDTTRTDRLRLLVLGDSFTQAVEVSDDKTYYAHLGDSLNADVFAYGCGGYGTVQEYLVLDRYVDRIRPDAVLIQYCSNDFINNDYDLERQSLGNNNAMRRPYLNPDGGVTLRMPKKGLTVLRDFANRHSRLLFFVFTRIDRAAARHGGEAVEARIEAGRAGQELLDGSARIFDRVLKKIKARVPPGVPVYLLPVTSTQPYYDALRRVARQNGVPWVEGVDEAIQAAERRGLVVRAADKGHWNEAGHRLAASVLVSYFRGERLAVRPQRLPANASRFADAKIPVSKGH